MAFARSQNDAAVGINAAPHLEGIKRVEVGIAIGAVVPVRQQRGHDRAPLPEDNGIGQRVGAARLRPLIAVHDPTAGGDHHLNRAAPGRRVRVDVNQPLRRVAGCCAGHRLGVVGRRVMHQQLGAGAEIAAIRRGGRHLCQHRPGRKADTQAIPLRGGVALPTIIMSVRRTDDPIIKEDVAVRAVIRGIHREEKDCGIRVVVRVGGLHITIVVALKGDNVAVTPARTRPAAGHLMMNVAGLRHGVIAILPEVIGHRDFREGSRAGGVARPIEVVRVDHRQALMHEVIGVLQLAVGRAAENRVLILGKLDPLGRAEGPAVWYEIALIQSGGQCSAALQSAVEHREQRRVQQSHAGADILAVSGGRPQVLAEQHRVVARRLRVETTAPVVVGLDIAIAQHVVPIAMGVIKHRLDSSHVAAPTGRVVAKKGRRHMLDRVHPEPVAFGCVKRPHGRPGQVVFHQLRHRLAVSAVKPVPSSARPAKAG